MKLLSTTALLVGVGAQPGPMADSPHPEPMAPVGVYPEEQTYVSCDTTKGKLEIEVNHAWAPIGAAHFLDMVKDEYYTDIALFRSVPEFIVQFGINDRTAPELRQKYMHSRPLDDDPHVGNKVLRGTLTYAGGSAHSRTSQLFFAYADQAHLGKQPWEVPFGKLRDEASLKVLDSFYKGYGDMAPWGNGPSPSDLEEHGNGYIRAEFPETDFIKTCKVVGNSDNEKPEL